MADKRRTIAELEARRLELVAEMAALSEEINQRAGEEHSALRQRIARGKQ